MKMKAGKLVKVVVTKTVVAEVAVTKTVVMWVSALPERAAMCYRCACA
jgi:hypothetical protein